MGKCVDCGYLSWNSPTKVEFHEIPAWYRKAGPDPLSRPPAACFRGMVDFLCEWSKEGREEFAGDLFKATRSQRQEVMRRVINKERNCDGFYPYSQGHSPKEHLSIQRNQEWQQRMATEQRGWQEGMNRRALIWGIVATVAGTVIATLAASFLAGLFG